MKLTFLARVMVGVVAAGLLWLVLFLADAGGQDALFVERGADLLEDYWAPVDCLRGGYARTDVIDRSGWYEPGDYADGKRSPTGWSPTAVYRVARHDRVYPAFSLLPFKLIPPTWTGGWCWTVGAGIVYLLALVLVARGKAWPLALAFSMPFVFALERGNPVWLSAACVAVFLAWWNDDRTSRRVAAAVALAAAAVLKVAPVLLGFIYLREMFRLRFSWRSWAMPLVAAGCSLCFFLVPWLAVPDGFSGISEFFENARAHGQSVLLGADFGLVPFWAVVRETFGLPSYYTPVVILARVSQFLGLCLVLMGVLRRDLLLLVGGMLIAVGNMYYYGALYLLPVLVLEAKDLDRKSAVLWFLLLLPVQLMPSGPLPNRFFADFALIGLMALRIVRLKA